MRSSTTLPHVSVTEDREHASEAARAVDVAAQAARAGGAAVRTARRDAVDVQRKGPGDLTTSTDVSAHAAIVSVLHDAFPSHAILGEDGSSGEDPHRWYVDALDGTVNYAHRIPYYAISVALWNDDQPVAAAVLDPVHEELFLAGRELGATLNGEPISVSHASTLEEGIVVTQSAARSESGIASFIALLSRLMATTGGVRMPGSRVVALCHVADGRYIGAAERSLDPWDLAAAGLIITEAGGRVTGFDGRPVVPGDADDRLDVVASNGVVHDALVDVASPAEEAR